MKKSLTFLATAILLVSVAWTMPSMPNDLEMVAPDPSLPKEIRAFWGKWEGTLFADGRTIDLFCVVEKIDKTTARLYLYTSNAEWIKVKGDVVLEYGKWQIQFPGNQGHNTLSLRGKNMDLHSGRYGAVFKRFG